MRLHLEPISPGAHYVKTERRRDPLCWKAFVDLLACLFLGVLILLIASCIVGSIVAALRAVSRAASMRSHEGRVPTKHIYFRNKSRSTPLTLIKCNRFEFYRTGFAVKILACNFSLNAKE